MGNQREVGVVDEPRATVGYALNSLAFSLALYLVLSMLLIINGVTATGLTKPLSSANRVTSRIRLNTSDSGYAVPLVEKAESQVSGTLTATVFLPLVARARFPAPDYPILEPPANDYSVPTTSTISIIYGESIDPTTVNAETFVVHGAQTGLLSGAYSVTGDRITMTPTHAFRHGDEIVVTLSDAISNAHGSPLSPFGWAFRSVILPTVVGGTGHLAPHPRTPSFGEGGGYLVNAMALGDLDGDGDLDAIEAGSNWIDDSESVWLNDGLGNLSPHPNKPTFGGGNSHDIALGDLDRDGDLDAVVANADDEPQTVWLNGGEGTMTYGSGSLRPHPTAPDFGAGASYDVALGDLDGDGDLDAVVVNFGEPETVWLNGGAGDFSPHPTTPTFGGGHSTGIALGDLDGDGDLDAVVVRQYDDRANTVWLNDGLGNLYAHPITPAFGDGESEDVALGDLDGDGDLDAVVANGHGYPEETVWTNDGWGNFSPHPTTPTFGLGNSTGISLGDLDGDGDLDAVVANTSGQENTVWMNDGAGNFSPHPITPDVGSFSTAVALGDLDGDGDLDVVFGNCEEPNTVWLNQNPDQADLALSKTASDRFPQEGDTVTYTVRVENSGPFTATGVTVKDVLPSDQTFVGASTSQGVSRHYTGTLELSTVFWSVGTLFPGESETLSIAAAMNPGTHGATMVNVAEIRSSNSFDPDSTPSNDLPGEDDQDAAYLIVNPLLVVATDPMGSDAIIAPDGNITVTFDRAISTSSVNSTTFAVRGAQSGVYVGEYAFPTDRQARFDATDSFKPGEKLLVTLSDGVSATDGAPLARFVWQVRAAVAGGAAHFVPHPTTPSFGADYSQAVSLGDLDRDGDLDALVVNSEVITAAHVNTVWLNDGVGNLTAHTAIPSFGAGASWDAALGDLDGDGDLDAVVAKGNGLPQTVWLNDGLGGFAAHPTTPSFGAGYSQAVVLGDIDGDSDLDAVVGHEDIGTTVWLNDGAGDFGPHLYTPIFGDGNSTDVALADLDGDGDLDAVVVYRWDQPKTVWLNDGTGSFRPHPTTPVFGDRGGLAVALGDLDGDGDLDAVIGKASANTVWLNDGTGSFGPHPTVPDFDSGGSGREIALGDLDGDGDLDALEAQGWGDDEVVWLNDGAGGFGFYSGFDSGGSTAVALGDLDGDGDLDAVLSNTSGGPQRTWLNQD